MDRSPTRLIDDGCVQTLIVQHLPPISPGQLAVSIIHGLVGSHTLHYSHTRQIPKSKAWYSLIYNKRSEIKVCRDTRAHEATLRGWLHDKSKLRNFVHNVEENKGLSLKRARKAHDSALHSAVNKWSVQEIADSRPMPIYGSQKVAGLM